MTGGGTGRHSGSAGFTAVELLAVLVIVALAAAIAMPNVFGARVAPPLRTAALEVADALRSARLDAIRANAARGLVLDLDARTYWTDGHRAPRPVPRDIAIEARLAQSGVLAGGQGYFRFYADGSSSGGSIRLQKGSEQAVIALDWLTGSAEVTWQR